MKHAKTFSQIMKGGMKVKGVCRDVIGNGDQHVEGGGWRVEFVEKFGETRNSRQKGQKEREIIRPRREEGAEVDEDICMSCMSV